MTSIEYKTGMMTLPPAEAVDAVVNTVNCVGVMGKGLAKEFKIKYPANYHAYAAACKNNEVNTGKMFVYKTQASSDALFSTPASVRYIINFPTKQHWKAPSRIQYISEGLQDLQLCIKTHAIKSIIIPALGCGLGGLNWNEVKPLIEATLQPLSIKAIVYEPAIMPTQVSADAGIRLPTRASRSTSHRS